MQIQYTKSKTRKELEQILELQKRNALASLSKEAIQKEGFITISHAFELLERMNDASAHTIAKVDEKVIGYALVMLPSFRNEIPLLKPMFEKADLLLKDKNYVVMGQICIDKEYRKKGIFRAMYTFYKGQLQSEYDGVVTEIATNNTRSLNAHLNVGFEILHHHIEQGVSWVLVYWDWR